jgi:hypothetical protein
MSDDEIQSALAEQFVSRDYRLIGKRDGKPFPLRTIFLTFEVPSLPSHIRVGYERVSAHIYLTRCDVLPEIGHTQQRCASNLVCAHCGESGHSSEPCPNPPHCVNRSEAHASADRKYSVYLDEKCIQELREKETLSFLDARKKLMEFKPKTGSYSYATVLRRA